MIAISNLYKSFGKEKVLKNIDLRVHKGELLVLIGPSGCGKSTLLRCINGLEVYDSGKIEVCGITMERKPGQTLEARQFERKTHDIRAHVGMVFQSFNLFPHMTLLQNLMKAPIVVQKIPVDEAEAKSLTLLDKVGLKSFASRYPHQLSGGQAQRAAIARALALSPKVMLYDEPTSSLDPGLVDEVLDVMKTLDQEDMTQIVVTHEMHFARNAADEIIYMEHGELIERAKAEDLFREPKDDRTKKFLRRFL